MKKGQSENKKRALGNYNIENENSVDGAKAKKWNAEKKTIEM